MKILRKVFPILTGAVLLFSSGCGSSSSSEAIKIYNDAQKALMKLDSYKQESVSINRPNDPSMDPETAEESVISRTDTILFNIVDGKKVSFTDIAYSGDNSGANSQYFIDHKNKEYYVKDSDGWREFEESSLSEDSPASSDSIYWAQVNSNTVQSATVEETAEGKKVSYVLSNMALEDYAQSGMLNLEEISSVTMELTTDKENRPLTLNSKYSFTRDIQGQIYYIAVEDILTFSEFNQVETLSKDNIVK